jgi:3-hydroxyisobutyrate dehydrogenase
LLLPGLEIDLNLNLKVKMLTMRLVFQRKLQRTVARQQWFSSSRATSATVGFLGLGNMGLPMAVNLAKREKVLAFDLSSKSMAKSRKSGVMTADSIEEIAKESSVIFTMLPTCQAVNAAMSTMIPWCGDKTIFVDCSTVSPTTSCRWHATLQEHGHDMIDAPVSGGVKGAQNASLTFMVGSSSPEALEVATALLELMGNRIVQCGGPGTGSATKLCNNLALAAQMVGICEAMNLGEALGVDPVVLANVMNTSTAKCWASEVNNPHPDVASQTGSPASNEYQGGFGTRLMLKDLGLAVDAGKDVRVALPIGTATKELYQMADLRGLGEKDFGVMLQFLKGK